MPAKKRVTKKTAVTKTAVSPKASSKSTEGLNPIVSLGKIISAGVILITFSFLVFGSASEIVFAIPISMGLVLLGIVFGLLANRKLRTA